MYTLDQFKDRKQKVENVITQAKNQISLLELQYNQYTSINIEDRIAKLYYFVNSIDSEKLSDKDKNELYKTIIDCIIWERTGDDITVEIKYLYKEVMS